MFLVAEMIILTIVGTKRDRITCGSLNWLFMQRQKMVENWSNQPTLYGDSFWFAFIIALYDDD